MSSEARKRVGPVEAKTDSALYVWNMLWLSASDLTVLVEIILQAGPFRRTYEPNLLTPFWMLIEFIFQTFCN